MAQKDLLKSNPLREFARSTGTEPSEFISSLSEAIGQSVWLCNKDFEIMWGSEGEGAKSLSAGVYEGSGHPMCIPLKDYLKELSKGVGSGTHKGVFKDRGRELGVTVLPLVKEGNELGYIVTIAEGIGAKLTGLLERQRKREELYALS
jgi:hypothetical protein